jgi:hypothetical protein
VVQPRPCDQHFPQNYLVIQYLSSGSPNLLLNMKTCSTCKESKDETLFAKNQSTPDGYQTTCKPCFRQMKSRLYRKKKELIKVEGQKTCRICGLTKEVTMFGLNCTIDGRDHRCVECVNTKRKQMRQDRKKTNAPVDWEGKKRCYQCATEKEKVSFPRNVLTLDGLNDICKECCKTNALDARLYIRKRKREMGPCVDCGESNVLLLQNDHVRGEKKTSVSQMRGKRTIEMELEKTEIRCIMCHRKRTFGMMFARPLAQPNHRNTLNKQKNRNYINQIKLQKGACEMCARKVTDDPIDLACFDFDHKDRSTKVSEVSKLAESWDVTKIDREVEKCRLLCAACHWLETGKQMGWHGY